MGHLPNLSLGIFVVFYPHLHVMDWHLQKQTKTTVLIGDLLYILRAINPKTYTWYENVNQKLTTQVYHVTENLQNSWK